MTVDRVAPPTARRRPSRWLAVPALAAVLLLAGACSGDDGADVRSSGGASGSGSGAGGATGSGSGSGTGLSEEEVEGTSDDPLVQEAVEGYADYVQEQVGQLVTDTRAFTDAVRASDLAAAKAEFAPSRQAWERIEPIAALVEDIDVAVDARVDDFDGPDDPTWTGWHKLEYVLWEQDTTEGTTGLADGLDADVARLAEEVQTLEITPLAVAKGSAELIEEVSEGKITGEEDRYSHTDLWDFAANVEGSEKAIELLTPALQEADAALLTSVQEGFSAIDAALAEYREGEGYRPYTELTDGDRLEMQAILASLSEDLATVPGTLELG